MAIKFRQLAAALPLAFVVAACSTNGSATVREASTPQEWVSQICLAAKPLFEVRMQMLHEPTVANPDHNKRLLAAKYFGDLAKAADGFSRVTDRLGKPPVQDMQGTFESLSPPISKISRQLREVERSAYALDPHNPEQVSNFVKQYDSLDFRGEIDSLLNSAATWQSPSLSQALTSSSECISLAAIMGPSR